MRLAWLLVLLAFSAAPGPSSPFVVPNFRDLKVRVRHTQGLGPEMVTDWYFKGTRERIETEMQHSGPPFFARILQCDLKTQVRLNERAKTYFTLPLGNELNPARERPLPRTKPSAPDLTVTIETVDIGERRQEGGYEARRVKTAINVVPAKGSSIPARKTEIDGWYVDIPGFGCRDAQPEGEPPGGVSTRMRVGQSARIVHQGRGRRGFAIEETSRVTGEGNVIVIKTRLVEFSEQPLNESLFEIPGDYTEAQPPVFGRQWSGKN